MYKKDSHILSVIVPVFNAEKYIARCLESIINQSFKDFELVIIDDASTDASSRIINTYLEKHDCIKYKKLNKNAGAGHARNIGMHLSTGNYIGFVDSDDWIDSNFYMRMINSIVTTDAEIAIGGIKTEYAGSHVSKIRYHYENRNVITGKFALTLLCRSVSQDTPISTVAWNKIYKKSYIDRNSLTFEMNAYNEDNAFAFFSLLHSQAVVLVPDVYYHYYQRSDSMTHQFSKRNIIDLIDVFCNIKENLIKENLYSEYKDEYFSFFEKCALFVLKSLFLHEQNAKIQKQYFSLFLTQCMDKISVDEYIDFLDMQRIRILIE